MQKGGGGSGDRRKGIIQLRSDMPWPTFSDTDYDVEKFLDDFEEIVGLGNEGQGLRPAEKLRLLGSCLKGSRRKAYDVIRDEARRTKVHQDEHGEWVTEWNALPALVYKRVITELKTFQETPMERQQRVDSANDQLTRGSLTARQFLPLFRSAIADLEKEGVGKSERDYLLASLRKVGNPWRAEIIKHQAMYHADSGVGQEF